MGVSESTSVFNDGYNAGQSDGYSMGVSESTSSAFNDGYNAGQSDGYSMGVSESTIALSTMDILPDKAMDTAWE